MNKAELKREALEVRHEIGLSPFDALDPYRLATEYGIDVYQLSEIDSAPCGAGALPHGTCHRLQRSARS